MPNPQGHAAARHGDGAAEAVEVEIGDPLNSRAHEQVEEIPIPSAFHWCLSIARDGLATGLSSAAAPAAKLALVSTVTARSVSASASVFSGATFKSLMYGTVSATTEASAGSEELELAAATKSSPVRRTESSARKLELDVAEVRNTVSWWDDGCSNGSSGLWTAARSVNARTVATKSTKRGQRSHQHIRHQISNGRTTAPWCSVG